MRPSDSISLRRWNCRGICTDCIGTKSDENIKCFERAHAPSNSIGKHADFHSFAVPPIDSFYAKLALTGFRHRFKAVAMRAKL